MGYDVEHLPIGTDWEEIVAAVREAHVTIITSDTGSGKSTRVPQFILDDHQGWGQRCRIAVTQQRRLAAMEISKRVASERGERIIESGHESVGYVVRDGVVLLMRGIASCIPRRTSYSTLLRMGTLRI